MKLTLKIKLPSTAEQRDLLQGKGIAVEDFTHIRCTSKRRNKLFRTKLGKRNLADLSAKMEYKALLNADDPARIHIASLGGSINSP